MKPPLSKTGRNQALRSLLLGGILPVVAFSLAEEYLGTLWALCAGMVLGVGEVVWERIKQGRVSGITWIGNGLLLGMGTIALYTRQGLWFKLQPALIEAGTAALMVGSVGVGRPFLCLAAEQQGLFAKVRPEVEPLLRRVMGGITLRLGLFFLLQAGFCAWAALRWSTTAWALLKSVGLTASLLLYLGGEMLIMRRRMLRAQRNLQR